MNPVQQTIAAVGCVLAASAVALGAWGAHGLANFLDSSARDSGHAAQLSAWDTAVRYHLVHAVVLVMLGLVSSSRVRLLPAIAILFVLGILIFSGLIYVWVLTDQAALVRFVPIGGGMLIVGWLVLTISMLIGLKPRRHR